MHFGADARFSFCGFRCVPLSEIRKNKKDWLKDVVTEAD